MSRLHSTALTCASAVCIEIFSFFSPPHFDYIYIEGFQLLENTKYKSWSSEFLPDLTLHSFQKLSISCLSMARIKKNKFETVISLDKTNAYRT